MRASFTIRNVDNNKVFIIDNDIGCSVTNDAEAVVSYVNNRYPNYRIIYRDTEGSWDELIHNNGTFVDFKPYRQ